MVMLVIFAILLLVIPWTWRMDVNEIQQPAFSFRTTNNSLTPPNSPSQAQYRMYWNHDTQAMDNLPVPSRFSSDNNTPTSFEILQTILKEYHHPGLNLKTNQTIAVFDKEMCLIPNVKATRKIAKEQTQLKDHLLLSFPILNMGFPKSGSSSMMRWFRKAGYNVTHYYINHTTFIGPTMLQGSQQHQSPFALLPPHTQVHAQMDFTAGVDDVHQNDISTTSESTTTTLSSSSSSTTIFPQIELLDEIHATEPNATFVLLFRPVGDWIRSAQTWNRYPFRWAETNIPGLVLTQQQKYERDVLGERIVVTPTQLQDWWCTHVYHIRRFVKWYPSHTLIELDVYNAKENGKLLSQLFQLDHTLPWSQANSHGKHIIRTTNHISRVDRSSALSSTTLYYQHWNFTSHTLQLDNDDDDDDDENDAIFKSSLHILEYVMQDKHFMQQDDTCFRPQSTAATITTAETTRRHDRSSSTPLNSTLSFPLLNVGLPMDPWNNMLRDFFTCLGLKVTHRKGQGGKFGSTGKKIKQAVVAGMVPLSSYFGDRDVYTHLDYTATLNSSQGVSSSEEERSFFPQIQVLDEIHSEIPNSTWMLPFPNFDQWLEFAQSFHNLTERWARMEMPGLPLTTQQYEARSLPCPITDEVDQETGCNVSRCVRLNDDQLRQWWCGHVQHIRKAVQDLYPSHTLIELDLDHNGMVGTKQVMQNMFPQANATCLSKLVGIKY